MALEWMPRHNDPKDHVLHTDIHWGGDETAPCAVFEKRPLMNPDGAEKEILLGHH
jgi:6-oxo-cyclohex-1-ene-carbonyl-CoA hydrolase